MLDTAGSPEGASGLHRRAASRFGAQIVAELAGSLNHSRHAQPHHVEPRLDHGRVKAGQAVCRPALAREPLDLALLGGRLARVRPVYELILDQTWDVTPSPARAAPTQDHPWRLAVSVIPVTAGTPIWYGQGRGGADRYYADGPSSRASATACSRVIARPSAQAAANASSPRSARACSCATANTWRRSGH